MQPRWLALGAVLAMSLAGAKPLLTIFGLQQHALSIGSTLPKRLQDASGRTVPLPTSGRSLVWLEGSEAITNPKAGLVGIVKLHLNKTLPMGRNLMLFFSRFNDPILPRSQRAAVAKQFAGAQVFYDEQNLLLHPGDDNARNLSGLYLVNGQRVMCRFMSVGNTVWTYTGVLPDMLKSAETFMKTGKVTHCPEPAGTPGAKVNTAGLPGTARVRLVMPVIGKEADAPPNSVFNSRLEGENGAWRTQQRVTHPMSDYRFRLDELGPMARAAGAVPIGIVIEPGADLAKMKRTFPGWTFIPYSKANRLRWLELYGAVLAPDGRVRFAFAASSGVEDIGRDTLTAALKAK